MLGFLGLMGIQGLLGIYKGDWVQAISVGWFAWFIFFIPQKNKQQ